MKPFWKQTTAQGSAVFGHDSSYFEWRNNSFKMGRISGKRQFLDLDTSASNTTELDPYKFTHFLLEVVRSMGSFGFQIWLERRSSRVSVFYFRSRTLQFGASVDVGRENFSLQARGSTNQWYTRRYGAKEAYPRLGSLAARQTFFQAVDRLPHPPCEVACILL